MTNKNIDYTGEKVSRYINSILKINKAYGFTEEIPPETINEAKFEVEKASRKYQKILSHP